MEKYSIQPEKKTKGEGNGNDHNRLSNGTWLMKA